MSRPMTRSYLKRIGLRLGDIWPYEMEEAEAKLRAEGRRLRTTGGRVSHRMAVALLDEGRRFQRGRVTAEATTAEATVNPSGGAPALLCQDSPGTAPEAEATAAPTYPATS